MTPFAAKPRAWGRGLVFLCFVIAVSYDWREYAAGAGANLLVGHYQMRPHFDPGAHILFSLFDSALGALFGEHTLGGGHVFVFELLVLCFFSACVLVSRAGLVAVAGAHLCLFFVWRTFLDIAAIGYAVESWAVILSAVLLASIVRWRGRLRDVASLGLFGVALGFLPLMRQSARMLAVLPACSVLGAAVLTSLMVGRARRERALAERSLIERAGMEEEASAVAPVVADAGVADAVPVEPRVSDAPLAPSLLEPPFDPDSVVDTEATEAPETVPPESGASRHAHPEPAVSKSSPGKPWGLRLVLPLLFMLVVTQLTRVASLQYWTSDSTRVFRPHGTGYPLFASLGHASNPYNICWDDDCAMAFGLLIQQEPWADFNPAHQAALTTLWRGLVLEDPLVVLRGMRYRAGYLLSYLSGTISLEATAMDKYRLRPSWTLTGVSLAGLLALCHGVALCRRVRSERTLVFVAGSLAITVATLAPLLIVAPFYPEGLVALLCVSLFVLTPALRTIVREDSAPPSEVVQGVTRTYRLFFGAGVVLLLLLAVYCTTRLVVNRREAKVLLRANPVALMHELGFQYATRFNRLDHDDQMQWMRQMLEPGYRKLVYSNPDGIPPRPEELFRPALLVLGEQSVYVVVWLSDQWRMQLPSRVQGPRNSVLEVLLNSDEGVDVIRGSEVPYNYWKIADANWNGGYRMFCLPQPPEYGVGIHFFHVGAHNFAGGDHMAGLRLNSIGGGRLYRAGTADGS